jgi:hypothetical protein
MLRGHWWGIQKYEMWKTSSPYFSKSFQHLTGCASLAMNKEGWLELPSIRDESVCSNATLAAALAVVCVSGRCPLSGVCTTWTSDRDKRARVFRMTFYLEGYKGYSQLKDGEFFRPFVIPLRRQLTKSRKFWLVIFQRFSIELGPHVWQLIIHC